MSHHHHHHHHHQATSNIRTALLLNLVFSIIELVGGVWTQSVAIMADAVHDMGDTLALGLAWYLQGKSEKGSDAHYSYGHRRLSLLSAIFTALFLLVASIFILKETISRFFDPVQPIAEGMLGLAILGIVVNGYAAWKTSHGESMNEKMISWHMIEDLLGWVTVFFGSIIMMFFDVSWLDPLMSIGFTLFILKGVYGSLSQTIKLFLQAVPEGVSLRDILIEIESVSGVFSTHDCHAWSLDGESHVITLHVVIEKTSDMTDIFRIKSSIREIVSSKGKFHLTIEIESDGEDCPDISCAHGHQT